MKSLLKAVLLPIGRPIRREIRLLGLDPVGKAVSREQLTFLTPDKLKLLQEELEAVLQAGVKGDICEFGLAWGGSSVLIAQQASKEHPYHGFDVFGMIPPPSSEKDDDFSRERYEVIKAGRAEGFGGNEYYGYRDDSYGKVEALFARFGRPVDNQAIFLHKGLFEETLPSFASTAVAFAHIDCDWYDPVRVTLGAMHSRLSLGGRMIIDDYPEFGGCKAATDEFLAAHPGKYRSTMKARLVLERIA